MKNINVLYSIYGAANCATDFNNLKHLLNMYTADNNLNFAIGEDLVTVATLDNSLTVTFTADSFNN